MRHFPAPLGQPEMMRKNFMRSGICLYSWCTVPRMKFVFCLSARGVQFGFLLKLCAWKGKVSGMSTKFVFVTGGVVSGLGKGICAALAACWDCKTVVHYRGLLAPFFYLED